MKRIVLMVMVTVGLLPALWHLLQPGFFVTDDGDWMVIRFSAFHQELRSGQFPVRWLNRLNNGYGYPVPTFLYPGFMYAAEIPHVLGLGFVASVKTVMIVSVLAGFTGMYLWLSSKVSRSAAVCGSYIYAYHPYLLYDIYTRGSVGEVMALGIVPLALWSISTKRYILLSALYGVLILAHNTIALLFVPVLCLYHVVSMGWKRRVSWKNMGLSVLLGIGASASFWVPAVFELGNTIFSTVSVSEWERYFIEGNRMYLIGYPGVALAIYAVVVAFSKKKNISTELYIFGAIYLIGLLLSLKLSWPLWKLFPLGTFVQFPFRFVSYAVIAAPVMAGCVFDQIVRQKNLQQAFLVMSVVVIIGISFPSFIPSERTMRKETYYSTNEDTTTVKDEYMPRWAGVLPVRYTRERVTMIGPNTMQINTLYWPGFQVTVDGVDTPISYDNEFGLMRIVTPNENARVEIVFRETLIRRIANGISLVSLAGLSYLWVRRIII